jgi:hypothetical protein
MRTISSGYPNVHVPCRRSAAIVKLYWAPPPNAAGAGRGQATPVTVPSRADDGATSPRPHATTTPVPCPARWRQCGRVAQRSRTVSIASAVATHTDTNTRRQTKTYHTHVGTSSHGQKRCLSRSPICLRITHAASRWWAGGPHGPRRQSAPTYKIPNVHRSELKAHAEIRGDSMSGTL